MKPAPLFDDTADAPDGGAAHWLTTGDGVRIRAANWPHEGAKGTVLIFPGRTEYIEKYGMTARALQARGYAIVAVDWRGQGIADHLLDNRAIGHVGEYADYQHDVRAVMTYAADLGLPRPYFLLAHSMGGCIGLRALTEGLNVRAAFFSAPMWGFAMHPLTRAFAWAASSVAVSLGLGDRMSPGQVEDFYVLREPFEGNTLTGDPEIFATLRHHLETHPDLGLGGPSLRWLNKSLREMRRLSQLPSPQTPCLTVMGTKEAIVDPARIKARMAKWPNGTLEIIPEGRHEMLMDKPAMREPLLDAAAALFEKHTG
ncbi:MAG: alpha/beta hydrolase [Yoonia sp.]|uniref:alpha/beta hydrolase n=1 Tax=Yoonia sp. TaxID=2212373 RepID=UPI003EF58062